MTRRILLALALVIGLAACGQQSPVATRHTTTPIVEFPGGMPPRINP